MATMTLADTSVKELVDKWYHLLDVHAPVEELVPLLAEDGLEMYWPEGPTFGVDGFKGWYERVTRTFFDEVHTMKDLAITSRGDTADVKLVVNWQARVWNPPDAKSKWLGMDARQTWVVGLSADGSHAVVQKYVVDGLDPMEGSASL
jgi:SnoaL-like domain